MDALQRGRQAFQEQAWTQAVTAFNEAERDSPIEAEDLERLARALDLIGRDAESADAWSRAYHRRLERGEVRRAARCAFWLAMRLMALGEPARGGGWLSRARELLGDGSDCAEQGFILLPTALQTFAQGDPATAHELFSRAAEMGDRFNEP